MIDRTTDDENELYAPYITAIEEVVSKFRFTPLDKTTVEALDSLIALTLEDYTEIIRAKITTKVLVKKKVTESYILLQLNGKQHPYVFVVGRKHGKRVMATIGDDLIHIE